MNNCVHLGEQVGSFIRTCCGGREEKDPLFICNSTDQQRIHTVKTGAPGDLSAVELAGVSRTVEKVAVCAGCRFFAATVGDIKTGIVLPPALQPVAAPHPLIPPVDHGAPPKGLALRMWEEGRKRRGIPIPEPVPVQPSWDSLACIYRGQIIRTQKAGDETLKILDCHRFGECTVSNKVEGVRSCIGCPERSQTILATSVKWNNLPSLPEIPIQPQWRKRLQINTHAIVLNNSICEFRGELWMAYRNRWSGAEIRLCRLSDDFNVVENQLLEIPRCRWNEVGCEDPRLFVFNGKLHITFTGVETRSSGLVTHVMYARLDGFKIEQCYLPHFGSRNEWEKNWSMFEYDDRLFCEYSFNPRIVLEITDDKARIFHAFSDPAPPTVGTVRGGASPTLHDGEWFSFHHEVFRYRDEGWYGIGLHTFEDKPPFRLTRSIRTVLMVPIESDRPQKHVPHVVYPSGAVCRNGQWIVSYGYYDRYCELAAWDANEIAESLTNA